jgi:hypothetical protein
MDTEAASSQLDTEAVSIGVQDLVGLQATAKTGDSSGSQDSDDTFRIGQFSDGCDVGQCEIPNPKVHSLDSNRL